MCCIGITSSRTVDIRAMPVVTRRSFSEGDNTYVS